MSYLAILGRQPEFGLIELESVAGAERVIPFGVSTVIVDTKLDLGRLGGSQKWGRIIYQGPNRDLNEAPLRLEELPLPSSGKITFGLSYYGLRASPRFVTAAGLTLKKRLRTKGSVRFVQPQAGTSLSAAQVKFNRLIGGGFELMVASHQSQMVIAVTEQVQDIDWYAVRDYQRPTRSARVGMLPPKLAQIMVNTTSAEVVYDPFCGTGVVLQEALLLGRRAGGSDIAPEMVAATQANLEWLRSQRSDLPPTLVEPADATTLSLPSSKLAIVSEGYLGPNLSQPPTASELKQMQAELGALYASSLRNWQSQLSTGAEVTITTPLWRRGQNWQGLSLIDQLPDLGYTLKRFRHADSTSLAYHRSNQMVGRQLLILRKS